ncbi:MAG: hypothetical protein QOJ52_766 [Acidimicrobiaceae bacterium]|jgi:hypothetical protein|nr:hypothetical protein [Acidimicrobiaceae bacterium]
MVFDLATIRFIGSNSSRPAVRQHRRTLLNGPDNEFTNWGPDMDDDHHGLLIIRAWVEPGSSEPLRAQVRLTTDVAAGIERTATFSRADEVCTLVRAWLADICRGAEGR